MKWVVDLETILLGVVAFFVALYAAGCGWPVSPDKMPYVIAVLAEDTASGCLWVGGRGGGGGGAVPVVAGTGGYGSGELLFGRVNAPGTTLTIKDGACSITRDD